ncbi:unnamed protein product [Sphenostylis stenocarpa]|uniref:Uncharacterized protein n=1 Tax=Sphenostylis stenocarpa TaxID=92480 RepID=A0AA86W5T8_9FABA|nr:unnamed protein product [Sphenostylis stenocarpa]
MTKTCDNDQDHPIKLVRSLGVKVILLSYSLGFHLERLKLMYQIIFGGLGSSLLEWGGEEEKDTSDLYNSKKKELDYAKADYCVCSTKLQADHFVVMWANQQELTALHEKLLIALSCQLHLWKTIYQHRKREGFAMDEHKSVGAACMAEASNQ